MKPKNRLKWYFDISEQRRAYFNWIICWIILPNLAFLPVTIIGGPARYPSIIACGLVGLLARGGPYQVRVLLFSALIIFMLIDFIAQMFNMPFTEILSVAKLVFYLQPSASLEYIVAAASLVIVISIELVVLRFRQYFVAPNLLCGAVAVTLTLGIADYLWSKQTMGAYARIAPGNAPFGSATGKSGFSELADGKTNLMLVMVEAMGEPVDPNLREKLYSMWARPELTKEFQVTHGDSPFYGSTTSGEIRELCGLWGDYSDIPEITDRCLPKVLSQKGYKAISWHVFTPEFFERDRWYPLIGFHRSVWGKDMVRSGGRFCPSVFSGACDQDVPRMIRKNLQQVNKPQFVYWLTLNSHLPIVENDELGTRHCVGASKEADRKLPMVCGLFKIWSTTAEALAKEIARPDFPPTHILIVGDHMPPFTHQESRLKFKNDRVPWILLRWRGGEGPVHSL